MLKFSLSSGRLLSSCRVFQYQFVEFMLCSGAHLQTIISASESDLDLSNTPSVTKNQAQNISTDLFRENSKKGMKKFMQNSLNGGQIHFCSETVLLAYFAKLAKDLKPSTWFSPLTLG